LPDRLYVISKVYFSENACEIWATTFRDFYVPAIPWPGPSRPMSLRCVFARTLDSARARARARTLYPDYYRSFARAYARLTLFARRSTAKEILVASERHGSCLTYSSCFSLFLFSFSRDLLPSILLSRSSEIQGKSFLVKMDFSFSARSIAQQDRKVDRCN